MRIGKPLTLDEQLSRNPLNKGRPLAIEIRTPSGRLLRAKDVVGLSQRLLQKKMKEIDSMRGPADYMQWLGIEMVTIPAGPFIYQTGATVTIPEFAISKTPVTNGQYVLMLEDSEHQLPMPEYFNDDTIGMLAVHGARLPLVGIGKDAVEGEIIPFLSKRSGRQLRLPFSFEWEKAARGTDGRKYPWGNEFDRLKISLIPSKQRTPVDAHPDGASPYGVLDMIGNTQEMVVSVDWRLDEVFLYLRLRKELGNRLPDRSAKGIGDDDVIGIDAEMHCAAGGYNLRGGPEGPSFSFDNSIEEAYQITHQEWWAIEDEGNPGVSFRIVESHYRKLKLRPEVFQMLQSKKSLKP